MKSRRCALRYALLSLSLLVAGCVTVPSETQNSAESQALWAQREVQLRAINTFNLHGRIAGGAFGGGGEVDWQQNGDYFIVHFYGALGVGAILVEGTPKQIDIRTKDGSASGSDVEELVRRKVGWTVPLAGLHAWIIGLPRPGSPAIFSLDERGRLRSLDQEGWHIDYLDYTASRFDTSEVELPRRIALRHTDDKVRVVIDRWIGVSASGQKQAAEP